MKKYSAALTSPSGSRMKGRTDPRRTPSFTLSTALGSKSDLERDSGFSDVSSEYLSAVDLTDAEDTGRRGAVLDQDPAAQQLPLMGGSYTGLSPMIIMNNFLLKQPSNLPTADKQWGVASPVDVMPQSQVVLLQPVLPNGSNGAPKASCENGRQSRSYTPYKSYPRIAPHPGEHVSKKGGSSRLRGSCEYEPRQRKHHHHHHHGHRALTPLRQSHTYEAVNNQVKVSEVVCDGVFSSVSSYTHTHTHTHQLHTALCDVGSDRDASGSDGDKQKRFSNTYNILSKSGLLGITLRTKQLIKENRRTQSQLQQLQEQTALLLQALGSGDTQLWTRLQVSLQETPKEPSAAKSPVLLL